MVLTPYPMGIHGVYDKKLFDKKHCRQTIASVLFTQYIRICLLMRNQNTQQNSSHIANIRVCSV